MFGGETDLQISGADDTFAPWKFSNPWFGTLRGRAGVAFNNVLLYATLGLAYGDLKGAVLRARRNQDRSRLGRRHRRGSTASRRTGRPRSSISTWISAAATFSITGTDNGLHANLLRLGLNYHF